MDVYEGKRIKRILRQTRSKIAGLLNAISSAPTSLSSQPSQAVFSSCALPRRTSSRRPVVTFGKQSQKPASSAAAQIYSSSVSHCSGLGIREYRDLGPPLADFARSIRDHFEHEILEKLWTEEDEMELQLNGRIPSLRTLCAFAVGRTAPFIKNVEMDVDFVNDEEAWYEELPYHFRRLILLQQLCDQHAVNIPVPYVLQNLITACVQSKTFHQGFEMLKTYWTSCGLMRRSQLDFAFESAREMGKSRPWIDFISSRLSVRDICQSELMDNLETLDAHPRLLLCHAAVNFIAEWSTDFPSDPLSKSRIRILIATVIRLFELYSTLETFQQKMMDAVLFLLADRMDKFVLCSDLESTEALSLLLSGFNEFADPEEMGLWCSHFSEYSKDMDPARFDSHDSVLLFKASMELKAFMYSESASKLIVVLMNRITRGGCDIYSIEDCQNALKDIQSSVREKLGSQPLFSWRYENMLDSWILATPPPLKPCKDSGPSNACIVPASHQTPCKADPLCGTKETPRGKRKRMERAFHDGLSSDDENEAGSSSTVTRGIPQSLIWETYKPITSLENEDAIYMDQGESHKESPRSACQSTNQVLDGIFSEDDVLQPLQTSSIFNSKDSPRKKLPSPAKSAFVFTAPLPKTHEPDDFLM